MSSVGGKNYKVIITQVLLKAVMVGIHSDILRWNIYERGFCTGN